MKSLRVFCALLLLGAATGANASTATGQVQWTMYVNAWYSDAGNNNAYAITESLRQGTYLVFSVGTKKMGTIFG